MSADIAFEAAVDAVVEGDLAALVCLLASNPELIRARSAREHRATLLHYIAANGVEGHRQKSPPNAVEMLDALLNAGAEVDALANLYGGGATALGLVATSYPPQAAGVQIGLMERLLEAGASLRPEGEEGAPGGSLIAACLANGRLRAAEFLASRGAPMSVGAAAGLGRMDVLREYCALSAGQSGEADSELEEGFLWACQYGQAEVVEFLLERGVDINASDRNGQTGLHWAVIGGRVEVVRMLLGWKAPLEVRNAYGGTVLGQALWSAQHGGNAEALAEITSMLLAAGAVPQGGEPD